MANQTSIKCGRCGRRYRASAKDADQWNATVSRGVAVGATCPACQTVDENVEAEINLAVTDYGLDEVGRVTGKPKGLL